MLRLIPLLLVLAVSTGCASVAVSPQASVQQAGAAQLAADGKHREAARAWTATANASRIRKRRAGPGTASARRP